MAGNTIKNTIMLEGEAQYKKAMAEINRTLKENKSAVKAASAEYENGAESMEAQYRLGDALERQYEQQSAALDAMREHLVQVEAAYGKNSQQATELRTKINGMRAETAKTQTQLKSFRAGLDGVEDAADGAADSMDETAAAVMGVGKSAERSEGDVRSLAEQIGAVAGKKVVEFAIGGAALEALKDTLSGAVKFAFGEGIDGERERGYLLAGAGDAELTDARLAIKDAVDRTWAGHFDGMETAAAVETVDTVLDNAGMSNPQLVTDVTNMALTQQSRGWASVGEQMERADAMVKAFGTDWQTAFDLMTLGFQNSHDGGALMLKTFDENTQMLAQLGYDADDAFSVVLSAVNNEELGKNSNLNKGMQHLIDSVTGGGKESLKTLKALGLEATDIGWKAQQGGEAAAEAYQLVLTKLNGIQDEAQRNLLGKSLFGDQVWTATGGDIATALLAGFGQTIEADGATQAAMDAMLDNLGDQAAGLWERVGQSFGNATQPIVEAGTDALRVLNQNIDAAGGDIMGGLATTIGQANEQMAMGAAQAFDDATTAFDEWAKEFSTDVATGRWVDELHQQNENAKAETLAVTQTVEEQRIALDAKLAEINQAITEADIAGNYAEAAKLTGERDAIIADIAALATEVSAEYAGMGEGAAGAVEAQGDKMQTAADSLAGEAVTALDDAQPAMLDAGDELGSAGVVGAQAGLASMYAAGSQGAEGLVSGQRTGIASSYAAGYDAGKAFERGYRAATRTHSPSRAMEEAGLDTMDGLMLAFDEGESRVNDAGRALGAALADGYGDAQGGAWGAAGAQEGRAAESPSALVDAMLGALERVVVYLDGEPCGRLMAPGVSREISSRAGRTMAGRFSSVKGW